MLGYDPGSDHSHNGAGHRPDQKSLKTGFLFIQNAPAHTADKEGHRIAVKHDLVVRLRHTGGDIVNDPGHVKHQSQQHTDQMGQVIDVNAEIQHDGADGIGGQQMYQHYRDRKDDPVGQMHMIDRDHDNDQQESDAHLEAFLHHGIKDQNILRQIYLRDSSLVFPDQSNALIDAGAEKVPKIQTDEYKEWEILFAFPEHNQGYEGIHQHE